jgi:hypothetical protein
VRSLGRRVGALCVAAIVLAGCAPSHPSPHVTATPSLSIAVPLQHVACTLDNQCVAFGTQILPSGHVVSVAQSTRGTNWVALTPSPFALPFSVGATACSTSTCLLGGALNGSSPRDALARYDATTQTVTSVTPPSGGLGVVALVCLNGSQSNTCALVDHGAATGRARLVLSHDGGTSWTIPLDVTPLGSATVTSLACADRATCLVAANVGATASLYLTPDGGVSWSAVSTPTTWTSLTSLQCFSQQCDALVAKGSNYYLARSDSFGAHWTTYSLGALVSNLACTSYGHCVATAQQSGRATLSVIRGTTVTATSPAYVPTPYVAEACGSSTCVAASVTTLSRVTP